MGKRRSGEELLRDIRWGACEGLKGAAALCALALVLFIARGGGPDRFDIGVIPTMIAYCLSAVAAGTAVGALRPLTASLLGHLILGAVATLPLSLIALYGLAPEHDSHRIPRWVLTLGFAGIVGPLYGLVWWLSGRRT